MALIFSVNPSVALRRQLPVRGAFWTPSVKPSVCHTSPPQSPYGDSSPDGEPFGLCNHHPKAVPARFSPSANPPCGVLPAPPQAVEPFGLPQSNLRFATLQPLSRLTATAPRSGSLLGCFISFHIKPPCRGRWLLRSKRRRESKEACSSLSVSPPQSPCSDSSGTIVCKRGYGSLTSFTPYSNILSAIMRCICS